MKKRKNKENILNQELKLIESKIGNELKEYFNQPENNNELKDLNSNEQLENNVIDENNDKKNIEKENNINYEQNFIGKKDGMISEYYEILCQLGKGSYGKVYEVKNKTTGEIRACKQLSKSNISNLKKFQREIQILINEKKNEEQKEGNKEQNNNKKEKNKSSKNNIKINIKDKYEFTNNTIFRTKKN